MAMEAVGRLPARWSVRRHDAGDLLQLAGTSTTTGRQRAPPPPSPWRRTERHHAADKETMITMWSDRSEGQRLAGASARGVIRKEH